MNFRTEVIERSHHIPVVVDFWAPWCGPCRILGPTIEQLASESKGKWELVKVNTEEEQETAFEYGIRSIPNVKMFHKGQVIAEFAGALPRHQILKWLDEFLPTADKEAWSNLQSKIGMVPPNEAVILLKNFLQDNPEHLEARLVLARNIAFTDPEAAAKLLSDIKMGDPSYDLVVDIQHLLDLFNLSDDNHGGLSADLMLAGKDLQENLIDQAVERIIEVVKKDKSIHNDLPRRSAIAIFHLLGNQHPVTRKYRRLFDMALY